MLTCDQEGEESPLGELEWDERVPDPSAGVVHLVPGLQPVLGDQQVLQLVVHLHKEKYEIIQVTFLE